KGRILLSSNVRRIISFLTEAAVKVGRRKALAGTPPLAVLGASLHAPPRRTILRRPCGYPAIGTGEGFAERRKSTSHKLLPLGRTRPRHRHRDGKQREAILRAPRAL